MARRAPVIIPPTSLDTWIARRFERVACRQIEGCAKALTWAADEKPLIALVAAVWLGSRVSGTERNRRRFDHLALATVASAVLPHLMKSLVRRQRPDRQIVGHPRHGIP